MISNYKNFISLENKLSNQTDFLKELESIILEKGLHSAINTLKSTGISINVYGTNKYKKLNERSIKLLYSHTDKLGSKILDEYIFQTEVFNRMFESLYTQKRMKSVKAISDTEKFYAYLLALEIFLRILEDQTINKGRNSAKYPFTYNLGQNAGEFNLNYSEMSIEERGNLFEMISQESGKVIAFLQFYDCKHVDHGDIERNIDKENVIKSLDHLELIDQRKVLYDLFEDWKYNEYNIELIKANGIEITPVNKMKYLSRKISVNRYETIRMKIMNKYNHFKISEDYLDSRTRILAPRMFIDELEETDFRMCANQFFSVDLNDKCDDIPLNEWLRAYAIVRVISQEFLDTSSFPSTMNLSQWCVVKSIDEWKTEFIKRGISKDNVDKMLSIMTFDNNSQDLFDCPFIRVKDLFIVIPSIARIIQGSEALRSNLPRKGFDIAFKGNNFEKAILEALADASLKCDSLYFKYKTDEENYDEYECDAVFLIGNDLFICECKSFLQPFSSRSFYDIENKKFEAVRQLNRISNFYSSNLHLIREKFELELTWKPRQIHKLLILSSMQGEVELVDNVHIVDYYSFNAFLYRKIPTANIMDKKIKLNNGKYNWMLEGNITTNKLLKFIQKPVQIEFQKSRLVESYQELQIGDYSLKRLYLYKALDNIVTSPIELMSTTITEIQNFYKRMK
ncbi:hypothetical protein [Brevibacillus brevis]|uniref:hypothetical protein n=1 Tax=Brevibacillus brevis TaxID=1393 RepID=UPI00165E9667|nr:hypothetical protein [Brevibacillus brevis]